MNNIFTAVASDLGRTVAEAKPLLLKLNNADTSKRPGPGKWAKKEILGHLVDSASNNHQRFVRAPMQRSLTFPGYDQDQLVLLQRFRDMDWGFLVDFWASYNRFLAVVLTCLPADAAEVTCVIGDHKPVTLGWIAEDYVAHLKHHLNQILEKKFETTYGAAG
ncbi:MAG TPA: DinB family protein [Candidatus Angelobacter sp.]|nr:DinB family protein [Candidatus Angelobacter sp.]